MAEPFLSVVIAAKNPPAELLRLCVSSFAALANAGRMEIVVVLSGAMAELPPPLMARFAAHAVVEVPPEGIYAAYNAGISASRGSYVLFFGVDDIALPGVDFVVDELAADPGHYHLYAAACYMQRVGFTAPSRHRASLALRNWCHQGIFYLRSYLVGHPFQVEYFAQADHKMNIDVVSNRSLRFKVSRELVAYFSAGGVSSSKPDLAFRRDFPSIVAKAYGRPLGALVRLKQIVIDAILGPPDKRFSVRLRR